MAKKQNGKTPDKEKNLTKNQKIEVENILTRALKTIEAEKGTREWTPNKFMIMNPDAKKVKKSDKAKLNQLTNSKENQLTTKMLSTGKKKYVSKKSKKTNSKSFPVGKRGLLIWIVKARSVKTKKATIPQQTPISKETTIFIGLSEIK